MDWNEVRPVLVATYDLLQDAEYVRPEAVAEKLAREDDEWFDRVLGLLQENGYIGGHMVDQRRAPIMIAATEKGLREVANWPREGGSFELAEALLRLLDERIADEGTSEPERGKLQTAREALSGLPRELLVEVMAAYASRVAPGLD